MNWSNAMTATTGAADAHKDDLPGQQPTAGRVMIATGLLTAHPGNVRRDVTPDQEFLDSVAELGILSPLRVTPDGGGGYRVIEGHRRLVAAEQLGLREVPCDLADDREADEAGQFLDMYVTNHHRKNLSALEEADALFSASASGASRNRIRKATGLDRDDVAAALKAGRMTGFAREVAAGFGQSVTLEQLALLAEFDGDTDAVNRIMNDFCNGRNGQHAAERIRQERAELAEHERIAAQLTASGYAVVTELPPGAVMLHALLHDGQDLTEEAHTACPGRAVYFAATQPHAPRHFCADPEANGHASRYQATQLPDLHQDETGTDGEAAPHPQGRPEPAPDPARRLVIEGNRAWVAARTVRKRWLADTLFARRTAPKETLPFVTAQLIDMPQALRDAITRAPRSQLFDQLTGGTIRPDAIGAWAPGRMPLALLAVIATAYEDRMDGDAGRATWRTDQRFTQCNREEAGTYLRFLASAGYELSPVEQAVADGVPYTGDQPEAQLPDAGQEHDSENTEATSGGQDAVGTPGESNPENRQEQPPAR